MARANTAHVITCPLQSQHSEACNALQPAGKVELKKMQSNAEAKLQESNRMII